MPTFNGPARRESNDGRTMLARILATPNLEQVVPRMQPELLHRVIDSCGLEDCGELVALATPEQLICIFDLDLWRSAKPGMDEQFDADRFGVWLEVLAEFDVDMAAEKLAAIDADLVIAGLVQHARVIDGAVVTPVRTTDGLESTGIRELDDELACDVGGYRLVATRTDSWQAIVAILVSLDAEHPDYFHRVMRGCRALSNAGRELDELHDILDEQDQVAFDLAIDREQRRIQQGYVPPAQARAFLETSRQSLRLVNEAQERKPTLRRLEAYMELMFDRDRGAYDKRTAEVTDLANTLMSGCNFQGRTFTAKEAWDAAVAVCNLGLENWPEQRTSSDSMPDDFLINRDVVSVFQVGWAVLHKDVGMYTADRLLEILAGLRCDDRDVQVGLHALRIQLSTSCRAGTPWRARNALDVIAILDMPAWAALLGLIDECPVLHAAISASRNPRARSLSASDFEFISGNSQIVSIREFLQSLPETLRS
jgi:hypothetical protein